MCPIASTSSKKSLAEGACGDSCPPLSGRANRIRLSPKLPRAIRVRIPLETATPTTVDALHSICQERKGEAKVLFDVERPGDFMVVMEADGYNVCPDRSFRNRIEELCGPGSVRIVD